MTAPLKILVVDDEEAMREVLRERLESFGFEVSTAADGGAAERRVAAFDPDAVLSDVVLPDTSGLDLLRMIRGAGRDRPVILITAHGTVELAVEAMKGGATDFLTKPVDYERLRALFDGMASTLQATRRAAEAEGLGELVGTSKAMRDLFKMIREVASTDVAVLITGESGTGKEVAATTIHSLSRRAAAPFHAINCAAIPAELMESEIFGHEKGAFTGAIGQRKGCFEMAHGGTLFLDEIAEMPMRAPAQAAARARGRQGAPDRRPWRDPGRRAAPGRHQQGSRGGDQEGSAPRGPLLPPQRAAPAPAAAARAGRGHRAAGRRASSITATAATAPRSRGCRTSRARRSSPTRGRATCASCATSSSAAWCWPRPDG